MNSNLALVHEPFKCAICDTRFGLKTGLNSHLVLVHKGKDPFKCTKESMKKKGTQM